MASVTIYPERRKNEYGVLKVRDVPLLLFFSFEGKRLQYYTGERIDMKDWDFEKRKVLSSHPEADSINAYLNFLRRHLMDLYREAREKGEEITLKVLRDAMHATKYNRHKPFFALFIQFIEDNHGRWTLSTYRKVKSLYNHLRKFTDWSGMEPDLSQVDRGFLESLAQYFRKECGHLDSTIRKNIDIMYWFMNWAGKNGYVSQSSYRNEFAKILTLKNSGQAYSFLDREEVIQLLQLPLTDKKEIFSRDLFCLACFTGLSPLEMRNLRPASVQQQWLYIDSGSSTRTVPLLPHARLLLDKYLPQSKETIFRKLYAHKVNRYLKETGKKAGLVRLVNIEHFRNGEVEELQVELYRLLTLSLAKKTFVSLALSMGMDPAILSTITGHKTIKAFTRQQDQMDALKAAEMKKFRV